MQASVDPPGRKSSAKSCSFCAAAKLDIGPPK